MYIKTTKTSKNNLCNSLYGKYLSDTAKEVRPCNMLIYFNLIPYESDFLKLIIV